jgi:hypothetical protein
LNFIHCFNEFNGERRKVDKDMKEIKEMKKESEG